jgi:hypothetical protein
MDYVNPFGSYAQGYGQGVQQENTLQQDTRKARDDDWTHNYLDPIKLDNAKLDNRYNHFALPYQEDGLNSSSQLLHSRVTDAQLATGANVATATGDTNPLNYAGQAADPMYVNQSHESLAKRANFGHNLQVDKANTDAVYRQQVGQSDQEKAYAARYRADVYGERYQPGAAAPAPVGAGGMFGSPASAPAHPAVAYGYDPQQHGEATQAWMRDNHTPNYSTQHPQQQGQQIYDLSQSTGMPLEAAHSVLSTTPYEAPPEPSASDYYTTDQ